MVCVQAMLLRCKTVGLGLEAMTQCLLQPQELSSLWLVGIGCILQALLSRHTLTGYNDANVGYIESNLKSENLSLAFVGFDSLSACCEEVNNMRPICISRL